jgi:transcriptional regulator of acetoin/glycerol metabolism
MTTNRKSEREQIEIPRSQDATGQEVIPLAEVERRAILHALHVAKGDRQATAQLLDIGRTTLYRKLKQYGL